MASGSTAPFSGDFADIEGHPSFPQGLSAEDVIQADTNGLRQAAEARHAAGLAQVNADGGFFDAYVDESKIISKDSVTQQNGQGGKIVAKSQNTVSRTPDDQQGQISDAFGLRIKTNKKILEFTVEVSSKTSGIDEVGITDTNGNIIASKTGSFSSGDKITFQETLSAGTKFDVYVNGFNYFIGQDRDGGNFPVSGSNIDIVSSVSDVLISPNKNTEDFFTIKSISSTGLATSGSVNHKEFTFTDSTGTAFTPSKVGVFADVDTSGSGESVSFDLVNSSGTTVKTFQESDLNQLQSVSVSDDTFSVEANLSGDGSSTPEIQFLDVRGV